MNAVGTLVHFRMTPADRYLWTLPMFHANRWTFVWIVTAVGGTHICLRRPDPAQVFELVRREGVTVLCAAPTLLISLANAPRDVRQDVPQGVRVVTAGAPPALATIEAIEEVLGWDITQVYGLTETAPFISSGVLARNEVARNYSYNRRIFLRLRQGFYTLNPRLSLRAGEEWVDLYEHLGRPLLEAHNREPIRFFFEWLMHG